MSQSNSKSSKTVMVLGARGMLGHIITTVLEESGHDVISVSRHGNFGKFPLSANLEDWDLLRTCLEKHRPDWVINAAGLLNEEVDRNKASAIIINSFLPQQLSDAGAEIGYRTITVGSDCVFEGNRGSYTVENNPDALSWYGRTKQLGELRNAKDLTIRTSIIGPEIDLGGRGLLLWLMSQENQVEGWTAAIWTGVTTLELAKVINSLVSCHLQETGLWQLVPKTSITKFDLLHLMHTTYLNSKLTINAVPGLGHDRSLVNDRAESWPVPNYSEMLSELKAWTDTHQDLYRSTVFELPRNLDDSLRLGQARHTLGNEVETL
jgi:dTDP-4-dehydrorhamnose reductase